MENQNLEKYYKIPAFLKAPLTEAELEHVREGITEDMKLSPTVIDGFQDVYCPVREEHSTRQIEMDATEAIFQWGWKDYSSVRLEYESDKLEEDILIDLISYNGHVKYLEYLKVLN